MGVFAGFRWWSGCAVVFAVTCGGEPADEGPLAGAASSGNGSDAVSAASSGQGGAGGAGGATGTSVSTTGGGMPQQDVFGIAMIYPTLPGSAAWTSAHWAGQNYTIGDMLDPLDPQGISGHRGNGTLTVASGTLTMSGSQPRLYIYPYEATGWRDVEFTVYYMRVADDATAWGGLVVGARSGADGHTSGTPCDAHTYYSRMRHDGAFDFEKELMHTPSSTRNRVEPEQAWPPDGVLPTNQWIGWKYVIFNDGQGVHLESYRDLTEGVDGGDWIRVNQADDHGGWFTDTTCSAHTPTNGESDQLILDGGVSFIRNTGVTDARYRWITVREIQP